MLYIDVGDISPPEGFVECIGSSKDILWLMLAVLSVVLEVGVGLSI